MDINLSSKAIEKLIETAQKGVGRLTKDYFTRRDADAEAYRIRQIAAAKADEKRLLASGEADAVQIIDDIQDSKIQIQKPEDINEEDIKQLVARAESREEYQRLREQHNVEQITGHAAEEMLTNEDEVSEEPVDDDWIHRFFEYAKFISDEQMQEIWGRILAGEVKQPGSYSYRTMETLRNLSKKEAKIISRITQYAINIPNKGEFVTRSVLQGEFDLDYPDALLMQQIHILSYQISQIEVEKGNGQAFTYGKKLIQITASQDTKVIIPFYLFTPVGMEISKLIHKEEQEKYLNDFVSDISQKGANITVRNIIKKIDETQFEVEEL